PERGVDGDDLHRQLVLSDQPLRGALGGGLPFAKRGRAPEFFAPRRSSGAGRADGLGKPAGFLGSPLRSPPALGHFGTVIRRHQYLLANLWRVAAGVEVVQAAVAGEADRTQHAHGRTISPA